MFPEICTGLMEKNMVFVLLVENNFWHLFAVLPNFSYIKWSKVLIKVFICEILDEKRKYFIYIEVKSVGNILRNIVGDEEVEFVYVKKRNVLLMISIASGSIDKNIFNE